MSAPHTKSHQEIENENKQLRELLEKAMTVLTSCSQEMGQTVTKSESYISMLLVSVEAYQNTIGELAKNGKIPKAEIIDKLNQSFSVSIQKFKNRETVTKVDKNQMVDKINTQKEKTVKTIFLA